ncbi:hypothetical protein, partial [Vibrio coralliilyticus]|uniref:hypothetical protein n=1 Tax=Vibrio coralliilyticus TaxID=190893 RepID=UPI00182547D5
SLSDKVSSTQKTVATSKAVSLVNKVANAALIKANTARVIAEDAIPKDWVIDSVESSDSNKPSSASAVNYAYKAAIDAKNIAKEKTKFVDGGLTRIFGNFDISGLLATLFLENNPQYIKKQTGKDENRIIQYFIFKNIRHDGKNFVHGQAKYFLIE